MPMGTIPVSSGRREGEAGGRMRAEESNGQDGERQPQSRFGPR